MARAGLLGSLTTPQLRECLEAHDLKSGGKRAKLIQDIEEYYNVDSVSLRNLPYLKR